MDNFPHYGQGNRLLSDRVKFETMFHYLSIGAVIICSVSQNGEKLWGIGPFFYAPSKTVNIVFSAKYLKRKYYAK
ncbi:hypothetical protein [Martelella alba]|uniref:Uncharacterized protein n=1 Tax=Martelella alba TaxID=2590451 RepID=A0ABY2SLK1_9HYPH|nr:hypothetical protein [Martelella alba]TKI06063.1 hypothetical protein FCN80_11095 [Martelella alba]